MIRVHDGRTGNRHLRHVTTGAVTLAHRAFLSSAAVRRRGPGLHVARQAFAVIRRRFPCNRRVRIVAGRAADALVGGVPAPAALQPVTLRTPCGFCAFMALAVVWRWPQKSDSSRALRRSGLKIATSTGLPARSAATCFAPGPWQTSQVFPRGRRTRSISSPATDAGLWQAKQLRTYFSLCRLPSAPSRDSAASASSSSPSSPCAAR